MPCWVLQPCSPWEQWQLLVPAKPGGVVALATVGVIMAGAAVLATGAVVPVTGVAVQAMVGVVGMVVGMVDGATVGAVVPGVGGEQGGQPAMSHRQNL
ncbi:MAG: hypothetical protein HQL73_11225 [Magnetococcales bacterium]|nr:hypothetical protein [Magnetococcales bacterium]